MKDRFAAFLVANNRVILIIFIVLALGFAALIPFVNVNRDMTKYLPADSDMRRGLDLMEAEFGKEDSSTLLLMFDDLTTDEQRLAMRDDLRTLPNAESVDYKLPRAKNGDDYNRDGYTLFCVNSDYGQYSDQAAELWQAAADRYQDEHDPAFGGSIDSANHNGLPMWIALSAVGLIFLVLLIMANSWVEPLAFLVTVGVAVGINMGSYIFFPSISQTTFGIVAILQLALSMDYSIMLLNRYRQQRLVCPDKNDAMRRALSLSFGAITGSSLTTFAGLLALLFMRFGIGSDIGLALAKGVLISLLCIFTVLPAMLLVLDSLMLRTPKKTIPFELPRLSRLQFGGRIPLTLLFACLLVSSFIARSGVDFSYAQYGSGDVIEAVFGHDNSIVMMYNEKDSGSAGDLAQRLEDRADINSAVCYESTIGKLRIAEDMKDFIDDMADSDEAEGSGSDKSDAAGTAAGTGDDDPTGAKGSGSRTDDDMDLSDSMVRLIYYDYFAGDPDFGLTLAGFVRFLQEDVIYDPDFGDSIDDETRDQINDMARFTDAARLTRRMTAAGLADFFGMTSSQAKQLLLYYQIKRGSADAGRMTLPDFVSFLIDDVAADPDYGSMISASQLDQLKSMRIFTQKKRMTRPRTYAKAARLLGMKRSEMRMVYVNYFMRQAARKSGADRQKEAAQTAASQQGAAQTAAARQAAAQTAAASQGAAQTAAASQGAAQTAAASQGAAQHGAAQHGAARQAAPKERTIADVAATLHQMAEDPALEEHFGTEEMAQLIAGLTQIGQQDPRPFDISGMAQALAGYGVPLDEQTLTLIYTYADVTASPGDYKISIKKLIHFILKDRTIRSSLTKKQKKQLRTLRKIIDTSVSGRRLTPSAMGSLLDMKASDARSIYLLYLYKQGKTGGWKLSPQQFINFLVSDVLSDDTMKSRIGGSAGDLRFAQRLINAAVRGTKYTYRGLADLLEGRSEDMSEEDLQMLYELYGSRRLYDDDWRMDLMTLVYHLDDDMIDRPAFAREMNENQIEDVHEMRADLDDAATKLHGEHYGRMMISADLEEDSDETRAFMDQLTGYTDSRFSESVYLIGSTPMAYETSQTFHEELNRVTLLTALFILIIVLATFRRLTISVVLVLIIQCAVFLTMAVLNLLHIDMNYLALLIVQSIMMGATIDYAIIYSTYYVEHRTAVPPMSPAEAIRASFRGSLQTILTSATILIAAVGLLSFAFEEPATRQICRILSVGCLIATVLVIFLLPGILACLDRLIIRRKKAAKG